MRDPADRKNCTISWAQFWAGFDGKRRPITRPDVENIHAAISHQRLSDSDLDTWGVSDPTVGRGAAFAIRGRGRAHVSSLSWYRAGALKEAAQNAARLDVLAAVNLMLSKELGRACQNDGRVRVAAATSLFRQ